MTLIEFLVKKGIVDKDKAKETESEMKASGKRAEEVILEKGFLPEDILFSAKSENLKIPLKDFKEIEKKIG